MSDLRAQEIYHRLFDRFGPQHWWPGQSGMEIVIGAVLVQNTNWRNVERAIDNLREHDLLDARRLVEVDADELESLLQPAGYFRVKAKRLLNLMRLLVDRYDGSLDAMFETPLGQLRDELLAVNGIGPETADSILLYAGNLPSFVVDAYTHRIFARHGWIGFDAGYYDIKDLLESQLPDDPQLFNEFHALLVRLGKDFCKKTKPLCAGCPLEPWLHDSKPLEPDWL